MVVTVWYYILICLFIICLPLLDYLLLLCRSGVSDSLWSHEFPKHTRAPCTSPSPGAHSNSCPSSRWCQTPISSSVIPFSSCPQSLSVSESFPMSQLFAWGGQSTGVSALASFLPKKSQGYPITVSTGLRINANPLTCLFYYTMNFRRLRITLFSLL